MKKKTLDKTKAGISNIWVALLLPVLVGFMGLAIDVGYMVWVAQQLQIGADAGALAGVRHLPGGNIEATRQAAQETTGANTAVRDAIQLDLNTDNAENGDIVIGRFNREQQTFTATLTNPNAVMVVARRTDDSLNGPLPLLFGPALGFNTADLNRSAIAMFGGGTGHGLIVLSEDAAPAFEVGGGATLRVNGGSIQVNSSADGSGSGSASSRHAAHFQGGAGTEIDLSDAHSVNIVGEYYATGNLDLPPINTEAEVQEDPIRAMLESLEDPAALSPYEYLNLAPRSLSDYPLNSGVRNLEPGYYLDGLSLTGGTNVLAPGVYALDGAGLDVSGNTDLIAEGVLFYIMGTGALDLRGTGQVRITPIEDTIYEGMSMFQAYGNTNEARILGNAFMELEGAFYFPDNHLVPSGDSITLGNQLIVNTIRIWGNSTVVINYTGQEPGVGVQTFLVR